MKNVEIIYKNKARIKIRPTTKGEFRKYNIPKFDSIVLSLEGDGRENSHSFFIAPDELLDLAFACTAYLSDNNFIKR